MSEPAVDRMPFGPVARDERRRIRVVVVCSDRAYSESLRSHLAADYDVLLARNAGEAAAKAQALSLDVVVVDMGVQILGLSALARMRQLDPAPVICCLATAETMAAKCESDFDFVLARPSTGAELPDRIRFILAKAGSNKPA